jgi:hypothetical protein
MAYDIIKPKRPAGKGWKPFKVNGPAAETGCTVEGWYHESGLTVISAVEAPEPDTIGAEFHISISKCGRRCDSMEAQWVLRQFGVPEAKEGNHVPHGIARNFWRPVADRLAEYECPCQDSEPAIVEGKGDYVWRAAPGMNLNREGLDLNGS